MNILAVFSLAAAFLLSPDEPTTTPDDVDTVVYSKKTIIDISAARVVGSADGPSGVIVHELKRRKVRNLMRLRADFRDALEASADGPSRVTR